MTNPITDHTVPAQAHASEKALHKEDSGYHKDLKPRQIQMIAIGGAIGTGLFLGAGGRLNAAGPSLVIAYAVCGFFAFLILRALGELVLHRPSSGSFVSYAREFYGEKAAFVSGWFYWINWATTTIVDITAAALYMNFFGKYVAWMGAVPQWAWALIALVVVLVPEPGLREGLRRNGVLVRADQGGRAGGLPPGGHLLRHLRHPGGGPGSRLQPHRRQRRGLPQRRPAHDHPHAGRAVRLRLDRTRRHRRRRNCQPGKDHAQGHQLRGLPHRRLLRRLRDPAGPAAPVHLLREGRQPVRDVLRLHRRGGRGRHHEPRGPHRSPVFPERRASTPPAASSAPCPWPAPPRSSPSA